MTVAWGAEIRFRLTSLVGLFVAERLRQGRDILPAWRPFEYSQ